MASRITEGEIKLFGRPMGPFNVREFQDALIVHREHTLESLGAPVEPEAAAATPLPLPKGLAAQLAGDRDPYKLESVPPDVHLATVQHARLHEAPTLPRRANFVPTSASHPDVAAVPVPPDSCLLVVRMFSPTRPAVAQEFQVLTSQSLCELRDKLYCLAETNNLVDSVAARSSYLFIEDCFYDDTRHPQALKHSSSVIAWAKGDQFDGNTLTAGVMQDVRRAPLPDPMFLLSWGLASHSRGPALHLPQTTFRDLTIWLNKPYLFCHHGDCEHIFTFADLRGVEPSDEQDK